MALSGAVLTACCHAEILRSEIAGVAFYECAGCGKVISDDDPTDPDRFKDPEPERAQL